MSNIKERLLGAITVMSEQDANTLWEIVIENFSSWNSIPEVAPDETDKAMLEEIKRNPDCQVFVSAEEAMKELGL